MVPGLDRVWWLFSFLPSLLHLFSQQVCIEPQCDAEATPCRGPCGTRALSFRYHGPGGGPRSSLSISSCPVRAAAGGWLSSPDLCFLAHRASKGESGTQWAVRDGGYPLMKKHVWSRLALFACWMLGAEASSTPGRAEPQGRRSLGSHPTTQELPH